ncbi:hypothetical protein H4R19_002905, partial [Coemansia spiralis]
RELMNSYAGRSSSSNAQLDSVFLSQQHELMNTYASRSSLQSHSHAASVRSADGGPGALTPEFMAHMEKTAQELVSLCDMLTETLISLNVGEDPSANGVVNDMMADIKRRKHAHVNFVGMLGSDHIDTLTKLSAATDSVDRCTWLYEKTVNSHNEWRAIQESLQSSAASRPAVVASLGHEPAPFGGSDQPESSRSVARLLAISSAAAGPSSPPAMSPTSQAHLGRASSGGGTSSRSNSTSSGPSSAAEPTLLQRVSESGHMGAPQQQQQGSVRSQSPAHGMSSKARGKLADTSLPGDPEQGFLGPDSAYGGSGERPGH